MSGMDEAMMDSQQLAQSRAWREYDEKLAELPPHKQVRRNPTAAELEALHLSRTHDPVNHPQHYRGFSNGAEVIDITENLTFNTGNACKYAARAGRIDGQNKGNVREDLEKAIWYLNRELDRIGGNDG